MTAILDTFGCRVFNDEVMKERLTPDIYEQLHQTIKHGTTLNNEIAQEVADAMKQWATENGATHFTHWFHPLTGATAEKHESFVSTAGGGKISLEFSPSNLVKGEADASSFPSGGLRDTFEARGYTAWDPTSYAFIKDGILYIPTVFCSYGGEALDHKTPMLRSMEALSQQAVRVLKLLGNENVEYVKATAGAEQEYFLVDRKYYQRREDLILTGRTLIGAPCPKGQEMNDHYYGSIKVRVAEFMHDLNEELWKLGIQAKTEHNEVAPSQHELANNFLTVNVSVDQNNLTMEVMKKVARKHDLECLLHEKPFAGINGSGKHNNWSLKTDAGVNLLDPGDTPEENTQFLVFLCAVIEAVDEYQDLIRISIASAGNDHRLGASEAPPAVVSVFLGDELTEIIEDIVKDKPVSGHHREPFRFNVHTLPSFPRDNTDRNRTSPFAFTGNKFEFRMPGSSASISTPNTILNTVVAQSLKHFAERLRKAEDVNQEVRSLIRDTIIDHGRIVFNGNGYEPSWLKEAARRGLSNYASTPEALAHYLDEKNVKVMVENGVLSEQECRSRYEIYLEKYYKTIAIEARTLADMMKRDVLPAVLKYENRLAEAVEHERALDLESGYSEDTLREVLKRMGSVRKNVDRLEKQMSVLPENSLEKAMHFHEKILPLMAEISEDADSLEVICGRTVWPMPTYRELLFGVE